MSYRKAEQVLPNEIIQMIQKYVDGECLYIPRIEKNRREWGEKTQIRKELEERNSNIFTDYQEGYRVSELSVKYFLSEKSIQRIIQKMKMAV